MTTALEYIKETWEARHFWWHLALSDIRFRFRRSHLGILWAILNPLLLTLLLTAVMSYVFQSKPGTYAIYVFCGLVIWEVVLSCGNLGCEEFIRAESYIKQFKHPLMIYAIRTTLVALIYMLFGFIGLFAWVALAFPHHLITTAIYLLPSILSLSLVGLPLAVVCGVTNTKFRDFAELLKLIFQAIWYASPVFISADVLLKSKHLYVLVVYNPVYHLLQLFRAPMLHGQAPTLTDYKYVLCTAAVLWVLAIFSLRKNENKLIHYL